MNFAAVEFPPIKNVVEWPAFGAGFNKIALICAIAFAVPAVLFFIAGRRGSLVPRGVQGFAEGIVEFVENQIAKPGIGHGYERYVPLLTTFFVFIAIGNLFEVIPFFQMPMNARMGPPLVLALTAWATFIGVGLKHHGLGYLKEVAFPPGVPKALYILVTPIEILSTFIVRPFSHAVRLFANMLAGHILLVTFSVLCISLWTLQSLVVVIQPVTFIGLVLFTAFEVGVSFIQAFVFSILAAVYIGGALHPAH
ncbi:MAG: F0F1 ATP synthase subunit A [Acidimicrobiales bacterium]|nr:F0F1 ATP synthase subunit A [Acidimicrobiales bacterium]